MNMETMRNFDSVSGKLNAIKIRKRWRLHAAMDQQTMNH